MRRLTLRQLEILAAVARCESFSRASAELHLTQPAVSMQIKQLEGALGIPLFEHMGKHIHLTEAGREVLRVSEVLERELTNLDQLLADMQGLKGGTLTVSAASTASIFTVRLLAVFRGLHPDVRLRLNVVNRETLLKHLGDNSIDLALMGQPPEGHRLVAQAFMDNPLVVIGAAGHALAAKKNIPLERLLDEPLIGREQGSGTRSALEKFFAERGHVFQAAMEMNKNEAIKHAVEAGLGLGVVSLHTVRAEIDSGQLCVLDVQGFPLRRQWHLVHREGKRLSPAASAFARLVLQQAAEFQVYI
ncbi:MAG TPA: LysR family transcriptional regulator [Gammaproteobacteria bacterium]|nr:LysR family transcriptional regulator [Gammaproteobacteria bacterium]